MSSSGFTNLIDLRNKNNKVHIEDSTIKDCNMLLNVGKGNNDITIEGKSVVECNQYVFRIDASSGENHININLDGTADIEPGTGHPSGKGYLYSATGGIIDYEYGYPTEVNIEKGLLAGNDALLLFKGAGISVYMKNGSKYYQNNR